MLKKVMVLATLALWITSNAMAATSIGRGLADSAGKGTIPGKIDPSLDAQGAVDQITDNVRLTNGARPTMVNVKDGALTIDFEGAGAGQEVEAFLPDELAKRLAGGAVIAGGSATAAYAGIGAVLVAGGVLGGLAAAGQFDGSDEHVFSPAR